LNLLFNNRAEIGGFNQTDHLSPAGTGSLHRPPVTYGVPGASASATGVRATTLSMATRQCASSASPIS
jgi:hypothetical protein